MRCGRGMPPFPFRNSAAVSWDNAPDAPRAPVKNVTIWRVPPVTGGAALSSLAEELTDGEQARAAALTLARRRTEYICGHAARARLAAQQDAAARFSITHTPELILIAGGNSAVLGIDAERVSAARPAAALARRFFCAQEAAAVAGHPQPRQSLIFFALWTAKEAMYKAFSPAGSRRGAFQFSALPNMAEMAVSLTDADPSPRTFTIPAQGGCPPFRLEWFLPVPGTIGALVADHTAGEPAFHNFSWDKSR